MDEQLIEWIHRANSDGISEPFNPTAFDIGQRMHFSAVDIIAEICLGTALGCITSDSSKHEFLEAVERVNAVCQQLSVLLEPDSLSYYITEIPLLGPRLTPRAFDTSGIGRIMGVSLPSMCSYANSLLSLMQLARQVLNQEDGARSRNRNSMLSSLLDNGVPRVDAEIVVLFYGECIGPRMLVVLSLCPLGVDTDCVDKGDLRSRLLHAVKSNRASAPQLPLEQPGVKQPGKF